MTQPEETVQPLGPEAFAALAGPLLDENGEPCAIYPNVWVGRESEYNLLFKQ